MGTRVNVSKSCEPCRLKRRRCDLRRPECSQCQRAGITCPGYKDTFSLRLRDETSSTVHKVQLKEERKKLKDSKKDLVNSVSRWRSSEEVDPLATGYFAETEVVSSDPSLDNEGKQGDSGNQCYDKPRLPAQVAATVPLDQAALSYFMHTYAPHSSFYYFPNIYNALMGQSKDTMLKSPVIKPDVDLAISIPALVLLSQELGEPSLLAIAHARYAVVLAVTQQALSDPKEARSDSTLASVLLLGLVETIEFRGRRDPGGWDAHVLGAATLLQMRGAEQLQTELERHLYFHASANFKRRCALRSIRVPNWLRRLLQLNVQSATAKTVGESIESLTCRVSLVLENLADLRADVDEGNSSPSEWLQRASALSGDLDYVSIALREHAPYQTVAVASSGTIVPTPHGNSFHIYSSPRDTKRWNDIRMLRLYLAEYIRDALRAAAVRGGGCDILVDPASSFAADADRRLIQAMHIAQDASAGILSSVPYTLHLSGAPRLMASSLVLPLSSVALSEMPPDDMRMCARESLRYIGNKLGNPQAMESLQMIKSGHLETWATVPHCL